METTLQSECACAALAKQKQTNPDIAILLVYFTNISFSLFCNGSLFQLGAYRVCVPHRSRALRSETFFRRIYLNATLTSYILVSMFSRNFPPFIVVVLQIIKNTIIPKHCITRKEKVVLERKKFLKFSTLFHYEKPISTIYILY